MCHARVNIAHCAVVLDMNEGNGGIVEYSIGAAMTRSPWNLVAAS